MIAPQRRAESVWRVDDLVNLRAFVADAAARGRMILVPFDFDDAPVTDFYRQSAADAAVRTNRFDGSLHASPSRRPSPIRWERENRTQSF